MFQFTKYFAAPTLDVAYDELMKNKKNIILGGTSFLRMGNGLYNTGIDLMNLSLSYIREEGEFFHIGAMTTFREVETNQELNRFFGGFFEKSVRNILGVQFRNNVTVGATVFSKYGFSDLIPALLALETTVVLYSGGEISLEDFLKEENIRRDILVEVKIRKNIQKLSFQTIRKNSADYAVLNLALSLDANGKFKVVVGATPKRAKVAERTSLALTQLKMTNKAGNSKMFLESSIADRESSESDILNEDIFKILDEEITFTDNMRASEKYRRAIAKVMLKRAIDEVTK